ncbi:MAG: 7-carboxy-7-deazaguanine synthase QueE [Sulfolobales archaeon]|nr:7-carboxy-7-deazaguanine synthase QueE [Sulfolobales archaeon]MCX8209315.1 7-carboxy-7-deazaguanine synthase QueE [Sulfolobales archaeon]MDW8010721.1 7-carboxy-7-deazaguanine synthase QueE [Sulfolobales archaeon]
MRISEIFTSVQGEGPSIGRPAVFLRLSNCNLRCAWCDTEYAWSTGEERSVGEVVEEIAGELETYSRVRLVVVTGGEPLLQKNELVELVGVLKKKFSDLEVEVETNCTVDPGGLIEVVDRLIASPKLSNSGMPERARRCSEKFFDLPEDLKNKLYLKFVVEDFGDLKEVEEVAKLFSISPHRVFLMPQASTLEELSTRMKVVVDLAVRTGYRVSDRLQVVGSFR